MSAGEEYVAHLVVSIEGSFDQAKRPLVVIDPEDREQVERLLRGYAGWVNAVDDGIENYPEYVDNMQAALRRLVTPPRPPEPLGLGAVVEDARGMRWVRVFGGEPHPGLSNAEGPWKPEQFTGTRRLWSSLAAVRVLSEGVTE